MILIEDLLSGPGRRQRALHSAIRVACGPVTGQILHTQTLAVENDATRPNKALSPVAIKVAAIDGFDLVDAAKTSDPKSQDQNDT